MKLTVVFLLVALLQVSAKGISQQVTLDLKNVTLDKVFKEIKKQSGYLFLYKTEELRKVGNVSVNVQKVSIEEAITQALSSTNFGYKIVDKTIILEPKPSFSQLIVKQDITPESPPPYIDISGTVADERGNPIIGASILIKGTNRGTISDANGRFRISVNAVDKLLVISSVGFETKEIDIQSLPTPIVIVLKSAEVKLDDVVIVGYGTQKKISVTGAISSVKPNEILRSPVSSVANALAGRAPGVITVQRGGEPGRDIADIFIRGVGTFAGGTSAKPLVLVDGVERSLDGIDPYTIESFNILKDASATAVFGVRGANGVIIITTKTGQAGKPQFTFSSNLAWQNPIRLPKLIGAVDYALLRNEAEVNDQNNPNARKFSDYDIERYRMGDDPYFHPDIDWMDYMLNKSAPQQQYNLNMSGGTSDAKYFVSLGYLNQDGAYKLGKLFDNFNANPNFKRYNIRANFDFNLTKELSIYVKASAEMQNSNYSGSATSDIFGTILSANPIMTPVLYDNKIIRNVDGLQQWNISNTPLYQMLFFGYNSNFSSRLNMNIGGRYKLDRVTKGLSIRGMTAYDSYYLQRIARNKQIPLWDLRRNPAATTFQDSIVPIPVVNAFEGPVTFGSETFTKNRKFYVEAAIEYNRTFARHTFTGLLLGTAERLYDGNNQLPFNYLGLVGRATYNYDNRYFLDINVGYNGSENFAVGKQFGFFPSFSASYLMSNEKFFSEKGVLTYLKLRGSYGLVGNDKIGGNRFLFTPSSFVSGNQYFLGLANTPLTGYREGTIGNPGVTWEKAKKLNVGADFKFFNDKLTLTADVFMERREGILWNLNIPVTFGAPGLVAPYNIGVAENKGYELELGYKSTIKPNRLYYFGNANFTFARNKIVYFDEIPQPFPGLAATGNRIGQPKGLRALGIYNTLEEINDPYRPKSAWEGAGLKPGDIRYADINGDGLINDNDRVNIGNPNIPEIVYGTTLGIGWNGFELSAFFQGAGNVSTYLSGEAAWPFIAGTKTAFERTKESWSQERYDKGSEISMPRLTAAPDANRHNYRVSSFWIQDASYLRLKTVEIAYTFNVKLINRFGIKSLRVYANGQNLFTWTTMPYFDPEIASSNGAVYPMMRVLNAGINLQF